MARKWRSGGSTGSFSFDKTKKYKYNSSGTLVEFTGSAGDDDITVSGSKSVSYTHLTLPTIYSV